jgi:hypothetical protein
MDSIVLQFLKTGKFGEVGLGMSSQQVESFIGIPEASTDPDREPIVHRYGNLQLSFFKDSLVWIGLYFSPFPLFLPCKLVLESEAYFIYFNDCLFSVYEGWPHINISVEGFLNVLNDQKIQYTEDSSSLVQAANSNDPESAWRRFIVDTNVAISFNTMSNEIYIIEASLG